MMGLVLMWTTDSFRQPPSRPPPAGGRSRNLPPPLGGGAESSLPQRGRAGVGVVQYGQNDVQSQVDQVRTNPKMIKKWSNSIVSKIKSNIL